MRQSTMNGQVSLETMLFVATFFALLALILLHVRATAERVRTVPPDAECFHTAVGITTRAILLPHAAYSRDGVFESERFTVQCKNGKTVAYIGEIS